MGYTPPYLEVRKATGGWNVYGPTATTGDDLFIYPNTTDAQGRLAIYGGGSVIIDVASAYNLEIRNGTTSALVFTYDSANNQYKITSAIANKDLYLATTGSGVLKVPGTATGTGDVAINGHYDIKDSTGATIKLATVA